MATATAGLPYDRDAQLEIVGPIGDADLMFLEGNRHVIDLRLSASLITDEGLKVITRLPRLLKLTSDNPRVGDTGLQYVAGCQELALLAVDSPCVTNAGLVYFHRMSQLWKLVLKETHVTDNGISELQKALRTCRIVY